jgi:hypothetical protein
MTVRTGSEIKRRRQVTTTHRDVICLIALALFLLMAGAGVAPAEASTSDGEVHRLHLAAEGNGDGERMVTEEETIEERDVETHTLAGVSAGYRFLTLDRSGLRAAPYEYLHSSITGGLLYNRLGRDLKFAVEGNFLNEKDFHGDLLTDYKGLYRIHARTESLFHNLDHLPLFAPAFFFVNRQGQRFDYTPQDLDPTARHGVAVERDLVELRYKPGTYPLHVNLGYWRLLRDGSRQLRFADHTFEATDNTFFSATRRIDRVTHEGTAGVDAHIGPVDLVYTFLIRQFNDNAPIPSDLLATRTTSHALQHNEDPDSRFLSHTVKMHTSLDGGITAGGSFTYGIRENRSRLTDVVGADQATTTTRNVAGDLSYIPCAGFTLAVKYRRQEVDPDSPATLLTSFTTQPVAVRQSFPTSKDVLTTTLSVRPTSLFTVKGEYRGEYTRRDLTTTGDETLNWHGLPENSASHRGTVALLSRPFQGVRLKAQYSYTATDHPVYGTSAATRHEGQLLATYTRTNRWGITANYRGIRENNDAVDRLEITSVTPLAFGPISHPLVRDKASDNVTTSVWVTPVAPLTLSASYGFLRTSIDQGIMFSVISPALLDVANYTSQAQIYAVSGVLRLDERLSLSLALQQVRSFAEFDPKALATTDVSGVREISRLKTVESSLSARADYRLTDTVTCSLDYSYRDYDDKVSSSLNGTVQTIIASVAGRW